LVSTEVIAWLPFRVCCGSAVLTPDHQAGVFSVMTRGV
jgi:hypothetical protein